MLLRAEIIVPSEDEALKAAVAGVVTAGVVDVLVGRGGGAPRHPEQEVDQPPSDL